MCENDTARLPVLADCSCDDGDDDDGGAGMTPRLSFDFAHRHAAWLAICSMGGKLRHIASFSRRRELHEGEMAYCIAGGGARGADGFDGRVFVGASREQLGKRQLDK